MSKKNKHKNIILENVLVTSLAAEGKSLARVDNKVIFIDNAVPEDIVDIKIGKSRRNHAEGTAIKFHRLSPKRVDAFCSHFGVCGGCKWQFLVYSEQLFWKQQQVEDNLQRIAKVPLPEIMPILAAPKTTFYRNKLEFTFSNKRWLTEEEIASDQNFEKDALGFHIPGRFDKILAIDKCYLQSELSNEIRNSLKKFALENNLSFYDLYKHEGLLRILMIRTSILDQTMVLVQFGEADQEKIDLVMNFLKNQFPQITSLQYVINLKANDTFQDLEVICFAGKSFLQEKMEDLYFQVGAKSFFQTNSEQALHLYEITRQFADLQGDEIVYDLYTGTGTIANFVARKAKKVVGIEYVAMAIEDAKVNSQINKIDNTLFFAGDMKDVLNDHFVQTHGKPQVIITDPPRAGMDTKVVEKLLEISAEKIVYVSCNPATQARDIALLSVQYEVIKVQPVDMFPHTQHVENVVLLHKKAVL